MRLCNVRDRLCKKRCIVYCLVCISIIYLTIQTLLYKYTTDDDMSSTTTTHCQRMQRVVCGFLDIASIFDIPLILLDPTLLSSISSLVHQTTTVWDDDSLCTTDGYIQIGALQQYWTDKPELLTQLQRSHFSRHCESGSDPRLVAMTAGAQLPGNTTQHCWFWTTPHLSEGRKDGGVSSDSVVYGNTNITIHVLILYERTGGYWWHSKADQKHLLPSTERFVLGRSASAYDRIELSPSYVDKHVSIHIPTYIEHFLSQISQSTFIECHWEQVRRYRDNYGVDSSLEATIFQHNARNILKQAKSALDQINVPFWISSGTCLGWFRQCDVIAYSMDVDIGISIHNYNTDILPALLQKGFTLKYVFGKVEDSFELSLLHDEGVKLDIFFFYEEENHMWNGGTQAKTGKKFKYIFEKFTLCWTEFLSLRLRVPCETLSYITANYGSEWEVPITQWDWKSSPSNVHDNGYWPMPL